MSTAAATVPDAPLTTPNTVPDAPKKKRRYGRLTKRKNKRRGKAYCTSKYYYDEEDEEDKENQCDGIPPSIPPPQPTDSPNEQAPSEPANVSPNEETPQMNDEAMTKESQMPQPVKNDNQSRRRKKKVYKYNEADAQVFRCMIAGYYRLVLKSPPEYGNSAGGHFHGWKGEDGVLEHIRQHFELEPSEKPKIARVLRACNEWASRGLVYKGQRIKGQGRTPIIKNLPEYQIIIDCIEQGLGVMTAMYQLNEYREEIGLPQVGLTTVYRTMKRLKPALQNVKRRKQGSKDPEATIFPNTLT